MADIYSLNEDGMRKLIEAFRAQGREFQSLKRSLVHYSTRRHEAVYIPSQAGDVKIVRYDWLPAAYGGSAAIGIGGAAAISNGNVNPSERKIFPKLWQNAYTFDSNGDLAVDPGSGYVVNLGSLPLKTGWAPAVKLPDLHPHFGQLWAVLPDAPSHYGGASYTWTSEGGAGDWTLSDGEAILLRGAGSSSTSGDGRGWVLPWQGDVMLTHMGLWEVTFGYRGYVDSSDYPYYDLTTGAASAGTAHTHPYRLPMGFIVEFGLHRNFQPGVTTIGNNADDTLEMRQHHTFSNDLNAAVNWRTSHQKTAYLVSDVTPWHGQHHTRLSPYIKVTIDPSASSAGTPHFVIDNAWVTVRPARDIGKSGDVDGFFAGANQYPGGYGSTGAGSFVWYGGGTEPDLFDKDGVVIP